MFPVVWFCEKGGIVISISLFFSFHGRIEYYNKYKENDSITDFGRWHLL